MIIFSGSLVGLGKEKSLKIVRAFVLVGLETCLGCVLFELLILLFFITPLGQILNYGIEGLFSVILIIAILNEIVLYWLNHFLNAKLKISSQVQMLYEYIIQWGLIYVTVYQVMFDNFLSILKN
ncbi:SA1002 family membrane protein [Ligilactobacillus murinus]|uniref:SA1002 family membrane protein n=1 Tax=Ligilactobacillus murinus TaxID=1622 RepID=UPI003F7B2A1C